MSIHVSPIASQFRSRPVATPPSFPGSLPAPASRAAAPTEGLAVHLGHMGVVIAITARPPAAGAGRDVRVLPADADTIYLEATPERLAGCAALLDDPDRSRALNVADPVVNRLVQALATAEGLDRTEGGVCADALRLAILTRLLGVPVRLDDPSGAPAPMDVPALDAVPAPAVPRRLKSGLPKWRLKRVAAYVEENLGESVTLAGMADAAGLSRMHFAAQFRITTGMRPHDYLLRQRIERAQRLLLETRDPLVEIALAVGFQTQAHFTTVFRRLAGDTPYQWRCANRPRR